MNNNEDLKLIEKEIAERKQAEEKPATVEDMAKAASGALLAQVEKGDKKLHEAAVEAVKAGATAKASTDNADKYAHKADKIITNDLDADEAESRGRKRGANNADNEKFYETFRPILEFDFEFITGIPKRKQNAEETQKTKSFSKGAMVVTISFAIIPWLLFALVCYLFKGVNAIVVMISGFTKAAKGVVFSGLGLAAVYIVLKVIDHYLRAYVGISIFPNI